MLIHYIKANPSGNTTLFVFDAIAPALRSTVASTLLKNIDAEQVGYLTMREGQPIRIDMMGGEFCGNASRSAAAYALMTEQLHKKEYSISCSGCNTVLKAWAGKRADSRYDAFINMPRPNGIDSIIIDVDGQSEQFYRVLLPGIVHFVHFTKDLATVNQQKFWQALYAYTQSAGYEAFGLILFDSVHFSMIPAVYVTATDTLYWEQSCGSGSAAAAAALAFMGNGNISRTVRQPGGSIDISAVCEKQVIQSLSIGGPVSFDPPGVYEI